MVVVLNRMSGSPVDFRFKRLRVKSTGSSYQSFGIPFISVERMQLQSSNFVHKCTTVSYCLRIKNYARMWGVTEYDSL